MHQNWHQCLSKNTLEMENEALCIRQIFGVFLLLKVRNTYKWPYSSQYSAGPDNSIYMCNYKAESRMGGVMLQLQCK